MNIMPPQSGRAAPQHHENASDDALQNAPENAPENAVELRGLCKTYRAQGNTPSKEVLSNMTLAVPRGSIYGLLGPNGAGKSTLINILAGTVIKSSGQAKVWGVDIDDHPRQARANIGIVPQELNIDAFFTPRETLDFMAGMFAVPRHERRTDALLEEIGLTDKAGAYTRTLSGGMRRRLMVGKAMVHQPPVLVLDEPTAGVDVGLRQKLWALIRRLNDNGVTIILTTHYLEEAETLCDRIAIMNHGRLLKEARTEVLLAGAGNKDIILRLENAPQQLPAALADLNASIKDNSLRINFSPAQTSAVSLLERVSAAGLIITDVSTEEPDLEDVFMEITSLKQD